MASGGPNTAFFLYKALPYGAEGVLSTSYSRSTDEVLFSG